MITRQLFPLPGKYHQENNYYYSHSLTDIISPEAYRLHFMTKVSIAF